MIPEMFKEIDIAVNMAAHDMYQGEMPDTVTLFAVTSTGDVDEAVIPITNGDDAVEMIGDAQVLRVLSHFSRFGVYAGGTVHVGPKDANFDELTQEDIEKHPSYKTLTFVCWWDGQVIASTRILRPDGSGAEESPEGIRFGVPEYSDTGRGKLVNALTAAAFTGGMLRQLGMMKSEGESHD